MFYLTIYIQISNVQKSNVKIQILGVTYEHETYGRHVRQILCEFATFKVILQHIGLEALTHVQHLKIHLSYAIKYK